MPTYRIGVTRVYRVMESASFMIDAGTPEKALALAKQIDLRGDLEPDFTEDDGGPDRDSYQWQVSDKNGTLLIKEDDDTDDT